MVGSESEADAPSAPPAEGSLVDHLRAEVDQLRAEHSQLCEELDEAGKIIADLKKELAEQGQYSPVPTERDARPKAYRVTASATHRGFWRAGMHFPNGKPKTIAIDQLTEKQIEALETCDKRWLHVERLY